MDRTVIVVGGGVAGCALALGLRRQGLRCIVLERAKSITPQAGEHLPPDAQPYLVRLDLWDDFQAAGHLPSPGIQASWGRAAPHDREYIFSPYGCGWNLDRTQFDTWLAGRARQAGAEMHAGVTVTAVRPMTGGWAVDAVMAGEQTTVRGDFLVDATGRASAVTRRLGGRRQVYDRLLALIGYSARDEATDPIDARLLVEATPDGWWYAALLPGHVMVAAYMTDPPLPMDRQTSLQAAWLQQLAETTFGRERLARTHLQRVVARPADTYRMEPLYGPGWLAAGDAAAALDPLSAMGITHALASGVAAAGAILRHMAGDADALAEYAADVAWEFERQLVARNRYYRQEQRWAGRSFWQRRQRELAPASPISLDPFTILQSAHSSGPAQAAPAACCAASDLRLLGRLCAAPTPAHEAARAFKQAAQRLVPDEQIIHTIEYGVASGMLIQVP